MRRLHFSALSRDEDNVYVVLSARQLKPDLLIVARAEDERSETKLLRAGATRVVSPYVIGGSRTAGALLRPAVLDVIDLATHHRNIELKIEELSVAPSAFAAGITLRDSGLHEHTGSTNIAAFIVHAWLRPSLLFEQQATCRRDRRFAPRS